MKLLKILKGFFCGPVLDDFESVIFNYAIENLPNEKSLILKCQVELFNKVYRFFIDENLDTEKYICQFYRYKNFRNCLEFPRKFESSDQEKTLCSLKVVLPSDESIDISIKYVLGIACIIEMTNLGGIYRPLSPNFKMKDFSC